MSQYRRSCLIEYLRKCGHTHASAHALALHHEANPCTCKQQCPGHQTLWPHVTLDSGPQRSGHRRPQLAVGTRCHTRVTKCRCGCGVGVSGKQVYASAACRKRWQRAQDRLRSRANQRAGKQLREQYRATKLERSVIRPDEDASDSRSIIAYIEELQR